MTTKYQPTMTTEFAQKPLEREIFPKHMEDPDTVLACIKSRLVLDGHEKQNLATFCTTTVDPNVDELMQIGSVKNMIDKDLYPETAKIEIYCAAMLADLWNAPNPKNSIGTSTVGSSEACMLGGMAMKRRWKAKQEAAGKDTSKPNLVTGPVQICWKKFCSYFEIEHREVPIRKGSLGAHPDDFLDYIDENTIGVVPTFGLTFTLVYEDVKGLNDALDRLYKEKGIDVDIHVDAASGGAIAPFIEAQKDIIWDFRLPRVKSISLSGHKYGLAPLGLGWVVWREKADLPESLIFYVNYLGSEKMSTFALNFSRPASSVLAQYYQFIRLGKEGFRAIQQTCINAGVFLGKAIENYPELELIYDGEKGVDGSLGIPGIVFKLKEGFDKFTLFDLQDQLKTRGWQTAAYTLPKNDEKTIIMRILIRYGVTAEMMKVLADDIRKIMDRLSKN